MLVYILVNRTLIGFVIGVSTLRLSWPVHGIVIGLVAGLPFALGCLLEPGGEATTIGALILGAVYGFLIELLHLLVIAMVVVVFVRSLVFGPAAESRIARGEQSTGPRFLNRRRDSGAGRSVSALR